MKIAFITCHVATNRPIHLLRLSPSHRNLEQLHDSVGHTKLNAQCSKYHARTRANRCSLAARGAPLDKESSSLSKTHGYQ